MEDMIEAFDNLNPIEVMISRDNIEEFSKKRLTYTEQMTELCAFFGADKCLCHIRDNGGDISPLINLYSIMMDTKLSINIPHEEELIVAIRYRRFNRLSTIQRPSIKTCLKALMESLSLVLCDDSDYPKLIYDMYPPEDWFAIISGSDLRTLISFNHPTIFRELKLSPNDLRIILKKQPEIELDDSRLPKVIIVREGEIDDANLEILKRKMTVIMRKRKSPLKVRV